MFLEIGPTVISSIMGLFPDRFVADMKSRGIAWFACATTLAEAQAAESAGADAIVVQGVEAWRTSRIVRPVGGGASGRHAVFAAASPR
jgi:3-keto-L-gulonate-6-phosphate decarboxylase